MDPLSIAGSIAGLISLSDAIFRKLYHYVKDVKSAEKEVKDLKNEVAALNGVLHNLHLVAQDLEANISTPSSIRLDHVNACLALLYKLDEKLKTIGLTGAEKGKVRNTVQKFAWPFKAVNAKAFIEEIRQHRNTLHLAISADTIAVLLKNLSKQEDVLTKIAEIDAKFRNREEIEIRIALDKEKTQILDDFLVVDPNRNFKTSLKLRYPTTGFWLTENQNFIDWRNSSGSHLWLGGIPGAGKTVLSSLIIQECLKMSTLDRAVAFFYCDYKNEKTHDIGNILSTLASQLAQQNDDSFNLLKNYHQKLRPLHRPKQEPETDELVKIIQAMSDTFEDVRIVVDGLDECGMNAREVSSQLRSMVSQHDTISLALLSRDEQDIRDEIAPPFCNYIEIAAHTKDLEHYVRCEIEDRMTKRQLRVKSTDLKDEIVKQLVSRAHGMFRWVSCQLDELCDLPSDAMRRKALTRLPKTLYETYERILEHVNQQSVPLVRRTLQWIAYADPKLTLDELVEIVSFGEDDEDLDHEAYPDPDDILRSCRSLIRQNDDSFELSHFTVLEFLETIDPGHNELGTFRLSSTHDRATMVRTCVQYLCLPVFNQLPLSVDGEKPTFEDEHPFHEYACSYLSSFQYFFDPDTNLQKRLQCLFKPQKTYNLINYMASQFRLDSYKALNWNQCCEKLFSNDFTPLHAAAMLRLSNVCQWLLTQGLDVNQESPFGIPLECVLYGITDASSEELFTPNGMYKEVSPTLLSLLEAGADCSRKSIRSVSLSRAASIWGLDTDFGPLGVMVEHGLPLEMDLLIALEPHPTLCMDLLKIADKSPLAIVSPEVRLKLLELSQRENFAVSFSAPLAPKMSDPLFIKAVEFTVEYDQLPALKELIADERFHLDMRVTEAKTTLLHLAVMCGSMDAVTLLLDLGFDPAETDKPGWTVLHEAVDAYLEDAQILRRLAASSAVGIADRYERTVWHVAAGDGHHKMLEILLEEYGPYKPWLHAKSKSNMTPLLEAIEAGHNDCALMLLKVHDNNEQVFNDDRILQYTVANNMQALLEELIRCGANPKSWMKNGQNLLYFLTASVEPRLLETLLGSGLDVNCIDLLKQSPLTAFLAKNRMISDENKTADKIAIKRLATTESLSVIDNRGHTAWFYFCTQLVPAVLANNQIYQSGYLMDILMILVQARAHEGYEMNTKIPGMAFLAKSCLDLVPEMLDIAPPSHDKKRSFTETTDFLCDSLTHIYNSSAFAQHPYLTRLLVWSVLVSHSELISKLVGLGISVHEASDLLGGCSAVDACCLQDTGLGNLPTILAHADKKLLKPLGRVKNPILFPLFFPHGSNPIKNQTGKLGLLLEAGTDPDTQDLTQATAVHYAAECGNLEALKLLVNFGADLCKKDRHGWSVICFAVTYDGNAEMLSYLRGQLPGDEIWMETFDTDLPSGPLRLPKYFGCNLLHAAAYRGDLDIIQYLEETGCFEDLEAQSADGLRPLHFAVCSDGSIARWLIDRGIDVNATFGSKNSSAMHIACHEGTLESIMALVEAGASFQPDSVGTTPEVITHPKIRAELLQMLSRCGFTIPQSVLENLRQSYQIMSAKGLCNAIRNGDMKICRDIALDPKRLNSALPECNNCTPLSVALAAGRVDVVDLFLRYNATTNTNMCGKLNKWGPMFDTVLTTVVRQPKLNTHLADLLNLSLEQEAHWSTTTEMSRILCIAAALNGEAVKIILDHIGTHDHLLSWADGTSKPQTFGTDSNFSPSLKSRILDASLPRTLTHNLGWLVPEGTALHVAAVNKNIVAVEEFIVQGADVNARDGNGETPLYSAIRSGHVDTVKLLIRNKALLQATNKDLCSPLMVACEIGASDLVPILIDHDLKELREFNGGTALRIASQLKDPNLFISLTKAGWDPCESDIHGCSPIQYALRQPTLATYIYSSGLQLDCLISTTDMYPVTWHWKTESHLHRLFRRVPMACDSTYLDKIFYPHFKINLLALCVLRDSPGGIRIVLEAGATRDFCCGERCTALNIACVTGAFKCVIALVRQGATLRCEKEECTVNAFHSIKQDPRILRWFLVGRYTEQLKITNQATHNNGLRYWSGVRQTQVPLRGRSMRPRNMSTLDYAKQLHANKNTWRSLVPLKWESVANFTPLIEEL